MKAAVVRSFGDPAALRLEDVPTPRPGPGEVTVDVEFAGVGFVDTLVRAGAFSFVQLPVTPGIEVAGRIREVARDVTALRTGQRVVSLLTDFTDGGMGGYAEVAVAKAGLTLPLTDADDLATAAAVVVNGATAHLATEAIEPGDAVAVTGASGGLGQRLVAAATRSGATSIVAITSSPHREAALKQLGATCVMSLEMFTREDMQVDIGFDTVGGEHRARLMGKLRSAGRLLLLGNASGSDVGLSGDDIWLRSLHVEGLSTGGLSGTDAARIAAAAAAAIADARLRPPPFETIDFGDVADAHRMLKERLGPGKMVLQMR